MDYTIEFVDKISQVEEEKMNKDLVAYETSHGIDVNYNKFSVVLKDNKGIVFGILNAFTAFAEIYVDEIWVSTPYRGKGFGKKLLKELENHFKGKGFNNINLVTSAFQAPGFYEKCGFQIEFVRENKKNPKLSKTFFVKFFDDDIQTQGILKNQETIHTQFNKKSYPLIIGFSGISGAGKSTLIRKLEHTLQATTLFWDEYDEISKAPQDYVKWYESSKNYDEWEYGDLVATLEKLKLKEIVTCPATKRKLYPTHYILFDSPLGYCHKATGKYIDFLVCLDTPPDIALARRLLRDFQSHQENQKMVNEIEYYLSYSRPLYILTPEEKKSDLIIDGSLPIDKQEQEVLIALEKIIV